MNTFKSHQFKFLLLSAGLSLVILIFNQFFQEYIHHTIWKTFSFLAILSFSIHILNTFLLKNFGENFLQIIVLAMILRFIASLVYIGVLVWPGMENIILFIANFFVIFLFYLLFDIYSIISNLRRISR